MKIFAIFLLSFSALIAAAPSTAPAKIPIVVTEVAKADPIFDILTYPARIAPLVNANLLSETEGVVESILVSLGTRVTKKQSLLVLRNTDPVYEYAPAIVQAPVSGVVSAIEVTKGSRITRGQKLGAITDPSQIKVVIEVAANDLKFIHTGLEGTLLIPQENSRIPAKVTGVSPFVDPATGTATAEIQILEKTKVKFAPGVVGKMQFNVGEHTGFQVSDSAIAFRGLDPFIRLVIDGKAKYQSVKLGRTRRGLIEVMEGLKPNDVVVARASSYISDGEAVTIDKPEAKASE